MPHCLRAALFLRAFVARLRLSAWQRFRLSTSRVSNKTRENGQAVSPRTASAKLGT